MMFKIMFVSKNYFLIESIKEYFTEFSDCKLTNTYNDIITASDFFNNNKIEKKPDFIIVDVASMDNADEEFKNFVIAVKPTRIIVLGKNIDAANLRRFYMLCASGVVEYGSNLFQLHHAMQNITQFGYFISPSLLGHLLENVIPQEFKEHIDIFSKKEFEIARFIYDGFSTKQISEKLFVSIHAVNFHIRRIYTKLKINSRSQLLKAMRQKL